MTNREWLNSLSDAELAEKVFQCNECIFCAYDDGKCHTKDCTTGQVEWLKQKYREPMPEIKAGDILLSTTPSEYYIAVASDKLLTARGLMVLDLEKVLRSDQIASIKRWNGTDIETIWRYDDDR